MFGGPLMILGLCAVGWAMLWARPHYGFAATYAVGLFCYNLAASLFYGAAWPPLVQYFGWSAFVVVAVSLTFFAMGAAIVAIRKAMKAGLETARVSSRVCREGAASVIKQRAW